MSKHRKPVLCTGQIVESKNGETGIVLTSGIVQWLHPQGGTLKGWDTVEDVSISKIYEPRRRCGDQWNIKIYERFSDLVWQAEDDVKEMTVAEIAEELGYKVKVVE